MTWLNETQRSQAREFRKAAYRRQKDALDAQKVDKKARRRAFRKESIPAQRRLSANLRARVRPYLKDTTLAIKLLGCPIKELQDHLEARFYMSPIFGLMTWDKLGAGGWHIDHIIPLSSFDLKDEAQLAVALHYTNLQPLWWTDNLAKGANLPPNGSI